MKLVHEGIENVEGELESKRLQENGIEKKIELLEREMSVISSRISIMIDNGSLIGKKNLEQLKGLESKQDGLREISEEIKIDVAEITKENGNKCFAVPSVHNQQVHTTEHE
jgi:hypothetical protein